MTPAESIVLQSFSRRMTRQQNCAALARILESGDAAHEGFMQPYGTTVLGEDASEIQACPRVTEQPLAVGFGCLGQFCLPFCTVLVV